MSLMDLLRRQPEDAPVVERAELRQYRYVLRTAAPETLVRLHADALRALDPSVRAIVLCTVQHRLQAGRDLTVDDVTHLARLMTDAEVRTPGLVTSGLVDIAHERLAKALLRGAAAEDLLAGYDAWTDEDPDRSDGSRHVEGAPRHRA